MFHAQGVLSKCKRKYTAVAYVLYVLLVVFILDSIFAHLFWKALATHPKYNSIALRCRNPFYHHSLRENVNTFEVYDNRKIRVITNSLGFKDSSNRNVSKNSEGERIVLIGDSFTEGFHLPYEESFAGIIDKALRNSGTEVLNAGVVSYCPKLYYLKTLHLIESQKVQFSKLVVFLDMSDVQDELRYTDFVPGDRIAENRMLYYVQVYSIRHSLILNAATRLFSKVYPEQQDRAQILLDEYINRYKTIDHFTYELSGWYSDKNYSEWGRAGFDLASLYMSELISLCKNNGIELILAVYPWPRQVDEGVAENRHVIAWKKFADSQGVRFINLYPQFMSSNPDPVISRYYLQKDFHFNEAGNRVIATEFLKRYNMRDYCLDFE